VAHVETQVERTIAYEAVDHAVGLGGWNARGMGIASSEGAGIGHYGEGDWVHMGLMRDELLGEGFTHVIQIYEPTATKAMITNGLNFGRRIVNYTGHGSPTSWGTTGFSNWDVNALTNVGMLPFIQSVACVNGEFDNGTCFAEAWLRAEHDGQPTGAIAAYMSTINQSWAPPMYGQGNHGYASKYAANERFCLKLCESVSALWFGGSCVMMDIAGSAGRDMFLTWTLFGDPSLGVVTEASGLSLMADAATVPLDAPIDVTLLIQPGFAYAGANYWLLGSVTGTVPGITFASGVHVPLNIDLFTMLTLEYPNGGFFDGFTGALDGNGEALAHLDTTGLTPLDPILAGLQMSFSAVVWHAGGPYDMATNVKTLMLTP
jgi:hypothetical protein